MFEALSDRFDGIFKRLRGKGKLREEDVEEVLREIRVALLEADVDFTSSARCRSRIRERAVGIELSEALNPAQHVIKIVHDELIAALGGEAIKITFASRPPTVVLMAGLQGSGKTTNSAKLARWFKQQGRNPILVGADLQRPGRRRAAAHAGPADRRAGVLASRATPSRPPPPASPRPAASGATCSSSTPPAAWPSTPSSWSRCGRSPRRSPRTTRSSSSTR